MRGEQGSHRRCIDCGRISIQAMPTSRDSGRADSPAGCWWRAVSGRQAQAATRAARVSAAPVARRLGPVRRPVIIEVAGLRHEGGAGGSQPAVQGLPVAGGVVRCWTATGFGPVIGLPSPRLLAIPAHFLISSCGCQVQAHLHPHLTCPLPPIVPPPPYGSHSAMVTRV